MSWRTMLVAIGLAYGVVHGLWAALLGFVILAWWQGRNQVSGESDESDEGA